MGQAVGFQVVGFASCLSETQGAMDIAEINATLLALTSTVLSVLSDFTCPAMTWPDQAAPN